MQPMMLHMMRINLQHPMKIGMDSQYKSKKNEQNEGGYHHRFTLQSSTADHTENVILVVQHQFQFSKEYTSSNED